MASISKIPSLNGIRALSVILVVISHCGYGHIVPGGFGVTVFFFLSGFLITTLFIHEYKQTAQINILHFYARRAIRLYPAMFIALLLAYSLAYFKKIGGEATLVGAAAQIFYFANYFNIFFEGTKYTPDGTEIFWSLSVEEHFYFLYPLIFSFFILKTDQKKLLKFLMALTVIFLFWRYYLIFNTNIVEDRIFYASDTRIDSIIFGCILALFKNPINIEQQRRLSLYDFFLIISSILLLLITFLYRDEIFRLTLRYTLQGIALLPLFYYSIAFSKHRLFSFLNFQILEKIGIYSYSIYLVHFVLLHFIQMNVPILDQKYILVPTVLITSIFFGFMVYHLIEKPLKKYRIKYR